MLIFRENLVKFKICVIISLEEIFMAATYTHHLFTKDVYQALDAEMKLKIDLNIFNLFGKSFDALFFYKPKLGSYMHKNNANLYFANIITYLRTYHETKNRELLSYLYGSICHYVLDSTVHPFIYYYGGKYDKKNKKAHKYRGRHDYLECMIDAILYQERFNKPIYKAHVGKEVFPKIKFTINLKQIIDDVYKDTFEVSHGSKIYFKGYKRFRFAYKHLMNSRFGIKKKGYFLFDFLHILPSLKLQHFCYYVPKLDYSVLNLEHKKWCYPVDKKISFHYSFYDLYDVAIVKAVRFITMINDALDKDDKAIKKVLKEIGNLGYGTGVNENRKVSMKYFAN